MKKIGTQFIETKRLLLRPFLESDAQAMYDNWASRPDNLLHVTWDAHESPEVTRQSIAHWVENYGVPATVKPRAVRAPSR